MLDNCIDNNEIITLYYLVQIKFNQLIIQQSMLIIILKTTLKYCMLLRLAHFTGTLYTQTSIMQPNKHETQFF